MICQVCDALHKPVNTIMGLAGTAFTVAQLVAVGVKRVSLGSSFSRAAPGGFLRAAREAAASGTFAFAAQAASFRELDEFMQ